jgi:heme O synthase-like polyprenyltransferase
MAVFVIILASALLVGSLGLVRRPTAANAWRLFKCTAPYLAVLFAVVALNGMLSPR